MLRYNFSSSSFSSSSRLLLLLHAHRYSHSNSKSTAQQQHNHHLQHQAEHAHTHTHTHARPHTHAHTHAQPHLRRHHQHPHLRRHYQEEEGINSQQQRPHYLPKSWHPKDVFSFLRRLGNDFYYGSKALASNSYKVFKIERNHRKRRSSSSGSGINSISDSDGGSVPSSPLSLSPQSQSSSSSSLSSASPPASSSSSSSSSLSSSLSSSSSPSPSSSLEPESVSLSRSDVLLIRETRRNLTKGMPWIVWNLTPILGYPSVFAAAAMTEYLPSTFWSPESETRLNGRRDHHRRLFLSSVLSSLSSCYPVHLSSLIGAPVTTSTTTSTSATSTSSTPLTTTTANDAADDDAVSACTDFSHDHDVLDAVDDISKCVCSVYDALSTSFHYRLPLQSAIHLSKCVNALIQAAKLASSPSPSSSSLLSPSLPTLLSSLPRSSLQSLLSAFSAIDLFDHVRSHRALLMKFAVLCVQILDDDRRILKLNEVDEQASMNLNLSEFSKYVDVLDDDAVTAACVARAIIVSDVEIMMMSNRSTTATVNVENEQEKRAVSDDNNNNNNNNSKVSVVVDIDLVHRARVRRSMLCQWLYLTSSIGLLHLHGLHSMTARRHRQTSNNENNSSSNNSNSNNRDSDPLMTRALDLNDRLVVRLLKKMKHAVTKPSESVPPLLIVVPFLHLFIQPVIDVIINAPAPASKK